MESSPPISIRLAAMEDVPAVAQIVAAAYQDCQEKFKPNPDKTPEWMGWWNSLAHPQMEDHTAFVIKEMTYLICLDKGIIGTFRLEHHDGITELDDFCILPAFQNKGFGSLALGLMEKLENVSCIELATPYFCKANRYLYEKAGYRQTGTRSNETVICYRKALA